MISAIYLLYCYRYRCNLQCPLGQVFVYRLHSGYLRKASGVAENINNVSKCPESHDSEVCIRALKLELLI